MSRKDYAEYNVESVEWKILMNNYDTLHPRDRSAIAELNCGFSKPPPLGKNRTGKIPFAIEREIKYAMARSKE